MMDLIVAVDENWAIGKGNDLLFHIPEDMKFFRTTTIQKNVICGKNTLISFPGGKPLPNRRHFVLTHSKLPEDESIVVVRSLEELEEEVKKYSDEKFFVIGGESVYRQLYKKCKRAYVTKIFEKANEADVYFPDLDADPDFLLVDQGEKTVSKNGIEFAFCMYENKNL